MKAPAAAAVSKPQRTTLTHISGTRSQTESRASQKGARQSTARKTYCLNVFVALDNPVSE